MAGSVRKSGAPVFSRSMEGLATRGPLELDNIAFWVCDVHGWTFPFSSVPRCHCSCLNVVYFQVPTNDIFIERFNTKAEVVQISPLWSRRCTPGATELAVYGNEVNE